MTKHGRSLYIVITILALLLGVTVAAGGNLGTITAGSIAGVTAVFGPSGEVTLNSSGITLVNGTGAPNKIKWNDGSTAYSSGDTLWFEVDDRVAILAQNDIVLDPGRDGSGFVQINGSAGPRITPFAGSGDLFVCTNNSGDLYASATICAPPAPSANTHVAALEREVAELRAAVQQLASQR